VSQFFHQIDITRLTRPRVSVERRVGRFVVLVVILVVCLAVFRRSPSSQMPTPQVVVTPFLISLLVGLGFFSPKSFSVLPLLRRVDYFTVNMFSVRVALLRLRWRLNRSGVCDLSAQCWSIGRLASD
jgi:hypothetical protein